MAIAIMKDDIDLCLAYNHLSFNLLLMTCLQPWPAIHCTASCLSPPGAVLHKKKNSLPPSDTLCNSRIQSRLDFRRLKSLLQRAIYCMYLRGKNNHGLKFFFHSCQIKSNTPRLHQVYPSPPNLYF